MSKESREVQVAAALTRDEKDAFVAFAKGQGLKPSALLRMAIQQICPAVKGAGPEKKEQVLDAPMLLRWSKRDQAALSKLATENGVSRQELVRRIVRAKVHKEVPLLKDEILALNRSLSEVNAIGRNLNQIARRLHETKGQDNTLTIEYLENIKKYLDGHRADVSKVLRAAWGRFGDDD